MPNPQIRIDEDAIAILKEVCSDPSEAIRILNTNHKKAMIEINEDYWNHMGALLKKYSKSPQETKVSSFQTAATIRKIGNISKEDEIPEPRGFGGKRF